MGGSVFFSKKAQDWGLLGIALVLFASPWLIGYVGTLAAWLAWFGAVFIGYLGVAASFSQGEHWEEWLAAALGLGLIFAPWLLGFEGRQSVSSAFWLLGTLTVAVSSWAEWLHWHVQSMNERP